ncbi:MAG: phosphate ABC transporter permease subunit PstC [Nitrosopumilaceae archaeon]|nr:phosphate ABC transporter permease subunit PstC [Nitrosopumilaceae archaeon]NDB63221.1 phosphate ABC transporter permease subunit PstC [Nitrosopumilaceae archaeon]NDB90640.1 phosphate ABC transporter permease subunit PstC [Nitrososphaerota archaeon]NDB92602.1 phosphate ABC transporter permease subunit PstC [Nitrososphaeria archaeon]NDF27273.1 phosphate ABC transporter permease subunit PstC [Nitrosopumilaceae archaeon]
MPADKIFKVAATAAGVYILLIIVLVVGQLYSESHLIWEKEGLNFITGSDWNAVKGREAYGASPYIMGTLVTAGLAMVMGVPVSIGIAMFISQAPKFIASPLAIVIDLLAAVPSIIYGFWGLIVFRDFLLYNIEYPLHDALGENVWIFSSAPFGLDIFSASIILAIMIIPTISAVSREIMSAVPHMQKEAAYMLGATKWEMFKLAIFPYAKTGLIGAAILGLGRAVGETMAVTMLIGNATGPSAFPQTLFQPGQTMSSIIANEFIEASPASLHLPALIGIGFTLLLVAIAINIVAHVLVSRMLKVKEGVINA